MKILITGSNGLLGQKIVKRCIKHQLPFIATSKGPNRNPDCPKDNYISCELTDEQAVTALVTSIAPTAIIHTAAMTNVDQCEQEPDNCALINVKAVEYMLEAAIQTKAHFQLLSTDFVFDGKSGPYKEDDAVGPLSVYAQSKVAAEKVVTESGYSACSIVRTIIVYGTGHNLSRSNIVLWAMEALPKGETMRLVDDQFRAPTWADDLAYACMEIILRSKTGVFHIAGPKTMSVVEIVKSVARGLNLTTPSIETISSSTLNQPAARPPRTGFILEKAMRELNYQPKTIEETIPIILKELNL